MGLIERYRPQWPGAVLCLVGLSFFRCWVTVAADGREAEIAKIRKYYAEVEALQELAQEDIKFQCPDDPMQGVLTRRTRRDTGEIVRLDLGYLAGDHGSSDEIYYYRGGEVFFVLEAASWWGFSGGKEGQTIDTMRERRFYFAGGRCIRVLEKEVSSEKPEDLKGLISKEENRELDLADETVKKIVAGILNPTFAIRHLSKI